jgi:tellurite resistance protein TerB
MATHSIRPDIGGELRESFERDEQIVNALVTVSAFVALADGRVDAIERDEAVNYIDRQRLAPTISRQRIAEFFDARARHLEERDSGGLIVEALRPVSALSLSSDVVRIAELVAAADRRVDPNEVHVIRLIRLITMTTPKPKAAAPAPQSSVDRTGLLSDRSAKAERRSIGRPVANEIQAHAVRTDDWRLERLIDRLPNRIRSTIRSVRQARWLRIPMGLALTLGGALWFLPIAGLWMLPIGLALLADDIRPLRSLRSRTLDWIEHHRPDWLAPGSRPQ